MIDLHDLRERPDVYQAACKNKNIKLDVKEFLELDSRYRTLKQEVEQLRAAQNSFSKSIASFKGPEKEAKLAEMKTISSNLKDQGTVLKEIEEKWHADYSRFPSVPLDRVPVGPDDSANVEASRWGEPRKFDFPFRDHVELGTKLDILDLERGVKIGGSRSYFLKGDGARLSQALMQYAMNLIHERGYTLMEAPHIVKYEAMYGTSYFPGGEDQAYALDERDPRMYLIGTSEVSVCSYHADEILEETCLPIRLAGYSPCYRREAGTYGKDTAGIFRVHQFNKVEQVILCRADPAESEKLHAELLGNAENLMQGLGLPYRVMILSTGDMGQGQVFKHDIETWMPSRGKYSETHSCSSFYDFQARRLQIRYKDKDGKNKLCYTLNNTLVANTRVLIALLENFQNADGSVTIPEVLRPYMNNQEKITAPKR